MADENKSMDREQKQHSNSENIDEGQNPPLPEEVGFSSAQQQNVPIGDEESWRQNPFNQLRGPRNAFIQLISFLEPRDVVRLERVDRLLNWMLDSGTVDEGYWRPRYTREYGNSSNETATGTTSTQPVEEEPPNTYRERYRRQKITERRAAALFNQPLGGPPVDEDFMHPFGPFSGDTPMVPEWLRTRPRRAPFIGDPFADDPIFNERLIHPSHPPLRPQGQPKIYPRAPQPNPDLHPPPDPDTNSRPQNRQPRFHPDVEQPGMIGEEMDPFHFGSLQNPFDGRSGRNYPQQPRDPRQPQKRDPFDPFRGDPLADFPFGGRGQSGPGGGQRPPRGPFDFGGGDDDDFMMGPGMGGPSGGGSRQFPPKFPGGGGNRGGPFGGGGFGGGRSGGFI